MLNTWNDHYKDSSADTEKVKAVSDAEEINMQGIKARWEKNARKMEIQVNLLSQGIFS